MEAKEYGEAYLRNEESIKKVLMSKKIYDEDLLHDTYIALYEYTPHPAPCEFVTTFVEFYKKRYNWQKKQESQIDHYSYAQFAALEIFDESVGAEALDQTIDDQRTICREQALERLRRLLDYYYKHPQPDERNHRRACKILQLYLDGQSEREISRKLNITQQAVNQSIRRTVERLQSCHPALTI